jgi:trans-aconitate methyltransferase
MQQTPAHNVANPHLLGLVPPGVRRVVEVGCMQGDLARAVRAQHPGVHYTGIDIDPEYLARAAEHCDRAFSADIEKVEGERWDSLFPSDCWIFGDCLEHLRDPWALMRRIHAHAAPGAVMLVCVPNAQHWSVQWRLASGQFRYEPSGLLDRTHLRWFTRITLLEMFASTGWAVESGLTRRLPPAPQEPAILDAIRALAAVGGADGEQAVQDSLPFQYVFRLVRQ